MSFDFRETDEINNEIILSGKKKKANKYETLF